MDDSPLAEIKAFIEAHPAPTLPADAALSFEDYRKFGYMPRILYPVVSKGDISKAEADIGFPIPILLRRFYLEVSNGITGFSYSILGLQGGCAASAGTLVDQYFDLKRAFEYIKVPWRPGLLPFCDWGCCIWSCVDCTDETAPILTYDPDDLCVEDYTLSQFFGMWVKGSVRRSNCPEAITSQITNPFTNRKAIVRGRARKNPAN